MSFAINPYHAVHIMLGRMKDLLYSSDVLINHEQLFDHK